nr:immunoglobulin light chain junction region [Macaca mulatta]
CGKGTRLTF